MCFIKPLYKALTAAILFGITSTSSASQSEWQAKVINGGLSIASALVNDNALVAVTCEGTLMYGFGNGGDYRRQTVQIDGQDSIWVIAGTGEAGVVYSTKSAGIRQLKKGYIIEFNNSNGTVHRFHLTGFTRAYNNAC